MTDLSTEPATEPASHGPEGHLPAPGRGRRRALLGALAVAGLLLVVPVTRLVQHQGSEFCDRVSQLPPLSSSLDEGGTPGPALARYAGVLDDAAAAAPDTPTVAAARTLARHERRLGGAIGGSASGGDVVGEVARLDRTDPGSLADARRRLDDAIAEHCR